MGDKTPRRSRDSQPSKPAPAAIQENPKVPKAPPPPPAGLYSELGVKDETKEFGDLASRDRSEDPRGVVLHRTESPTMESARNSYRDQMANGNHFLACFPEPAPAPARISVSRWLWWGRAMKTRLFPKT